MEGPNPFFHMHLLTLGKVRFRAVQTCIIGNLLMRLSSLGERNMFSLN